ncbi:LysR family transcriptional regulator transcriptional regulator [Bordetella ansorpii]|uniref:LysR family transcriptional regulator transcriptional regulator n=1 Tax=Bordetella ansorpii TaxID=288768 RepID=A0A157R7Y3_9BORD|nr:transcriptional regulator GcvA [Bordetella ansorpii]SAI54231.1 LysR family transcriptional regulator transcriptional regulator [Bordetella ansorpii]
MFDHLPPLQTLRAFEAAARHLSMSIAADELHVTHGAISRNIKTLEGHLGVPLFLRLTRRIVLTEAGAAYHLAIARLLGELTRESERLRTETGATRLRISTSVSFASKWLAPRLHRLRARHPEFDIHLDVTDVNVELDDGQVDVAVRYGYGRYPRAAAERIFEEHVTPVCSPGYRDAHGGLAEPADLAHCMLLHEDRMLANWDQWLAAEGMNRRLARRGPFYSHGSMAIEAAIRGEGVALGRSALVAEDIACGRLVALFPERTLKADKGYDLVYCHGNEQHPKVKALRSWLDEETKTLD